jgi:Fe-S oxidoreductase
MPLPTAPIIGVLGDNLRKRKTVLPLGSRAATGWAQGLGIPMGGECVIYTGHMYQLIPMLSGVEKFMSVFENGWIGNLIGVGRTLNKAINLSAFVPSSTSTEQQAYNQYLRNIVSLLRSNGVEFGYLYNAELYVGTLAHDLGLVDVFELHARRVVAMLREHGVRRVITVDPHTTYLLKNVYPSVIPGFDIEVRSYLELLAESEPEPRESMELDTVIHDSCIYARYLETVAEPRSLLEKAGATIREPDYSRNLTFCCGGPAESLFPRRAHEIARKRMEQLSAVGHNVVTMCPICLANLKRAAEGTNVVVEDISHHLTRAYVATSKEAP